MTNKRHRAAVFQLTKQSLHIGAQPILENINLSIYPGEKVALLGASGAGKTTLLGLLRQQQAHRSAFQPQEGGLIDVLSAYQNIFIGGLHRVGTLAALWNLIRPLAKQRGEITALAQILGLADTLWQSADRLSGGQRQRVAIGRALFRQQPIFLGDEPVSALDPSQAQALLMHVLSSHQTAVVSLHNRQLALDHFDRILVLCRGQLCCDAPAHELTSARLETFYRQEPAPAPAASNLKVIPSQ